MRAVVAIKSTGGSGASRATRYISERDRDPEREGSGPRPLFSDREDSLTYRGADRFLTRGEGTPDKEDLIHIAVSFRNEDYEQLGGTDAERKDHLIEVAREGISGLREDLYAKELRWVAGIHLNTDNPHIHILISKEFVDRDRGKPRRIERILKQLLAHRETGADSIARPVEGRIGGHFVAALDRQIERVREDKERGNKSERLPGDVKGLREWFRSEARARDTDDSWNAPAKNEHQTRRNRLILGEGLEKRLRLEFAKLSYERAKSHGETFRFGARDESTKGERRISAADVQRRADARGARAASEQNLRTSDARRKLRLEVAERDVERHQPTLTALHTKLGKFEKKLEGELSDARRDHVSASALAQGIEQRYAASGEDLPTPLIARDTLDKLQEQAVSLMLADRVESLEQLRTSLSAEHGQPVRDDREAARLAAQSFTVRTEVAARQERAERFDQTRHLRRWEVGGERWSLNDLDRQVARQSDEARFFGKYHFHIIPSERQAAAKEVERLGAIRQELITKIDERRDELCVETDEARKLVEVLGTVYEKEAASRSGDGRLMPRPEFSREELARIEANAEATRDAGLLKRLDEFEKYSLTPERRLGRAVAREVMADVAYRESADRLATFKEMGHVQPLVIEGPDGRLRVHQLKETRPYSLVERILRPLIEKPDACETRAAIERAAANYHLRLAAEHEKNRAYLQTTREIAQVLRLEVGEQAKGKNQPAPEFTAKESINLEIYAERQSNPQDRDKYLRLARGEMAPVTQSHIETGRDFLRDRASQTERGRAAEPAPYHNRGHSIDRGR
jgi:hypothetical protein